MSTDSQIEELVEQRKLYQATMYRMKDGPNRRHYEGLLSKNTQALLALNANVFDIDDANRAEVEEHGRRMAEMSFAQRLFAVLRHWLPIILIALAIWYFVQTFLG